jgi:ABC-type branched-subunit amino acid transport system substrate-binding protein
VARRKSPRLLHLRRRLSPLLLRRRRPEMVVKIGHVAPLTGPIAHLGKDNENGARLAVDDANAKKVDHRRQGRQVRTARRG